MGNRRANAANECAGCHFFDAPKPHGTRSRLFCFVLNINTFFYSKLVFSISVGLSTGDVLMLHYVGKYSFFPLRYLDTSFANSCLSVFFIGVRVFLQILSFWFSRCTKEGRKNFVPLPDRCSTRLHNCRQKLPLWRLPSSVKLHTHVVWGSSFADSCVWLCTKRLAIGFRWKWMQYPKTPKCADSIT